MKFNLIRIGNRDFVDLGDMNSFLYNLSLRNEELDKKTLATLISADNYIGTKFAEKQPKEHALYEVSVPNGIFDKEIKRVLKENKKNLPKKSGESVLVIDQETYEDEAQFTETQINQLHGQLKQQNIELLKIFEEAVKKIQIYITAPQATTTKTKTPA